MGHEVVVGRDEAMRAVPLAVDQCVADEDATRELGVDAAEVTDRPVTIGTP